MIPIIVGFGTRGEELGSYLSTCPMCGQKTMMKVYQTSNNIQMYFVPIGKFNKHYYLVCHLCDRAYQLEKWEKDDMIAGIRMGCPEKALPRELQHLMERRESMTELRAAPEPPPQLPAPQPEPRPVLRSATAFGGVLQVLSGTMAGVTIDLPDGYPILIGKDPKMTNLVFDNSYPKVSRIHCTIAYDKLRREYYVVDQSTNGTFLEKGGRLEKGLRTPLPRGTIIKLASSDCRIQLM